MPNFPANLGISWIPNFAFHSPVMKGTSFLVLFLKGVVGLHKLVIFSFASISGWDMHLDYCDVEWFVLEMKLEHSVPLETVHKNCIFKSFVGYEDYSISLMDYCPL